MCRYIVTGTDVNLPVLLGPLDYGEQDGTNDVYCRLPLYEYRYLDEVQVEKVTQNTARPVETPSQAQSYTVVKGDSLWAICKKFYGDGTLAYKLATANGISNPNLIYPGQVFTIPEKSVLQGYAPTPAPVVAVSSGTSSTSSTYKSTSSSSSSGSSSSSSSGSSSSNSSSSGSSKPSSGSSNAAANAAASGALAGAAAAAAAKAAARVSARQAIGLRGF